MRNLLEYILILFRLDTDPLLCGFVEILLTVAVGSSRTTLCISLPNLNWDTAVAMFQAASQGVWNWTTTKT